MGGSKSYQECFVTLTICLGEKSPSASTVTKWYRKFWFERQGLEDDKHYHCLVTAVTVENIVEAKSLVKVDLRITCEEIQDARGISSGSVNNVLP